MITNRESVSSHECFRLQLKKEISIIFLTWNVRTCSPSKMKNGLTTSSEDSSTLASLYDQLKEKLGTPPEADSYKLSRLVSLLRLEALEKREQACRQALE